MEFTAVPKAQPGDKIAVLSTSFAAPAVAPAVHEQGLRRLADVTGLVPVEYPTTRKLGAKPEERAADINGAFADPEIRAIHAVIGGDDQITVVPHLDQDAARRDPKPYLGYSDNTHILNWLWHQGVGGYYGGSTQVQLGPGPAVDDIHAASLRAALLTGERLEITDPGESEDIGHDWNDPRALTEYGQREATEGWSWAGPPQRTVTGRTWGGCVEVVHDLLAANRVTIGPSDLAGGVLLLEASEELLPASGFRRIVRALGERGLLEPLGAVVVARPPTSDFTVRPADDERQAHRDAQRDVVIEQVSRYNPDAVIVTGPPFGHTRPQWILPYGGTMTIDGEARRIFAGYR